MAEIRCPRCGSEEVERDHGATASAVASRDIPLVCEACGERWLRTPKLACPRCGSGEVEETAVDSWAFDDPEDARDNPATKEWSYVDKFIYVCRRCHHHWEAVHGSRPYQGGPAPSDRLVDEGEVHDAQPAGRRPDPTPVETESLDETRGASASTATGLLEFLDGESRADTPSLPLGTYAPELVQRRITDTDAAALADGVDLGIVVWRAHGRFDTLDRPGPPRGRWWLIERDGDTRRPCWEFVPQLAAYVELIRDFGYHPHRVLFDTPHSALQLDLAVLDDDSNVRLLGEAKKETKDLDKLERGLLAHLDEVPEPRRGDEPRQLAWRLWTTRAEYLWLVGPADRRAFVIGYDPLRITRLARLPRAVELGLEQGPAAMMQPPVLR